MGRRLRSRHGREHQPGGYGPAAACLCMFSSCPWEMKEPGPSQSHSWAAVSLIVRRPLAVGLVRGGGRECAIGLVWTVVGQQLGDGHAGQYRLPFTPGDDGRPGTGRSEQRSGQVGLERAGSGLILVGRSLVYSPFPRRSGQTGSRVRSRSAKSPRSIRKRARPRRPRRPGGGCCVMTVTGCSRIRFRCCRCCCAMTEAGCSRICLRCRRCCCCWRR